MKKRRKRVPTAVVRKGSVEVKIFPESYQSGGRPYTRFIVEYYEGPNLRRRVKRSDLDDAKKEADISANRLSRGQQHVLQLSGTDRDAYLAAKRLLPHRRIARGGRQAVRQRPQGPSRRSHPLVSIRPAGKTEATDP